MKIRNIIFCLLVVSAISCSTKPTLKIEPKNFFFEIESDKYYIDKIRFEWWNFSEDGTITVYYQDGEKFSKVYLFHLPNNYKNSELIDEKLLQFDNPFIYIYAKSYDLKDSVFYMLSLPSRDQEPFTLWHTHTNP